MDDVTATNAVITAERARRQETGATGSVPTAQGTHGSMAKAAAIEVEQEYASVIGAVNAATLEPQRGLHRGDSEHPYVPYELTQLSTSAAGGQDLNLISFTIPSHM